MEKRAVVEVGRTPSEISGKPSDMIKEGCAVCKGETIPDKKNEKRLAESMNCLYNNGRDAGEY